MHVVTPDEIQGRAKENVTTEDGLSQVTHYFGERGPDNQRWSARAARLSGCHCCSPTPGSASPSPPGRMAGRCW